MKKIENLKMRVTKEIAQERMNSMLREDKFEVIIWEGTTNPAQIKCKVCGASIDFTQGKGIYMKKTRYGGFNGECNKCNRYKFAYENIKTYESYIDGYNKLIEKNPSRAKIYLENIKENEIKIEKENNIIKEYKDLIKLK
ncbi:hypothetical protein QJS64_16030 [Paraclostridium bifermentans]|uniref:Recombinase n=1 Tax=Paraclostridium bifermentans TaxID=1490 RepID=A0ABY8R397_PARBF|nr:hypothetical protein QJS64_16030 [Paraclostridium bifermentans]